MGIKRMSYKDLSGPRRTQAAAATISELHRAMGVPGVPDTQKRLIQAKIDKIAAWADGTLPERDLRNVPPTTAPRGPRHHEVVVTEAISIDESV